MIDKALKSGSDIRGTAIEANGESVNLTTDVVRSLGSAFVLFLQQKTQKEAVSVAVGHDSRLTAELFRDALIDAFKAAGCTIFDCGLCSTPSMYEMTQHAETQCDGAVMITASHHPFHKNGLKFFTKDGGLVSGDIDTLLVLSEQANAPIASKATVYRKDFLGLYTDKLLRLVRAKTGQERPLEGLKIVLDAGNGAGGFFADRVLAPLGADTSGSQYLTPDGNFPNHIPNPEDTAAMAAISRCVTETGADLGIIFDTDVDRAAVVDKCGNEMNRNKLIALLSAILLSETAGAHIVTDSVTSDGLKQFITQRGGVHVRYKRGYQNVIGYAKKLCAEGKDALLAIETSGHAAFRENNFLDDGAYLVVRILICMAQLAKEGKHISDLIDDLVLPVSRYETRIFFQGNDDFKAYGDTIIKNLTELAVRRYALEPSTYEGVRVNIEKHKGWFLLRQSVHDPNMALNIESAAVDGAKAIAKIVYGYLSGFKGLDCPGLKVFVEG